MVRKTKEEADQTRHLILDTAERVFHAKGVSRTSLADIAEAAGLTRGAIYWHFRNKVDLFTAMCDRIALPMEERREAGQALRERDPLLYLRELALHALLSVARELNTRTVFDIMLHKCEFIEEMSPVLERKSQCIQGFIANMQRAFEVAQERGLLRAGVDPRLAAIGLHAYISGLMSNWLHDPEYFSLDEKAGALVDNYLIGVMNPAAQRSA